MKILSNHIAAAVVAAAFIFGSANVMAQRGNFDPEQMRQRMMEIYQERLDMSGAEWNAVEPLILSVMEKQRAAGTGRGGFGGFGRGGRGGRGGAGGDGGRGGRGGFGGEPDPAVEALQSAIESGDAAAIKSKLAELRQSRAKAQAELKQAREKLRAVLKAKQEAQLVLMGMLD